MLLVDSLSAWTSDWSWAYLKFESDLSFEVAIYLISPLGLIQFSNLIYNLEWELFKNPWSLDDTRGPLSKQAHNIWIQLLLNDGTTFTHHQSQYWCVSIQNFVSFNKGCGHWKLKEAETTYWAQLYRPNWGWGSTNTAQIGISIE